MPTTGEERVPRGSAGIVAVVAGAVVALGAVAGATALVTAHGERRDWQQQVAAYESQVVAAEAASSASRTATERDYDQAIRALTAQIARAEEVYQGTNDRVLDDDLRWQLWFAATDAQLILAAAPAYLSQTRAVAAISVDGTFVQDSRAGRTFTVTTGTTPAVSDLQAATGRITEAIAAVQQSQQQWANTPATP
ncbi:hypothetical protein OCAE111667_25340 [Occultella aeris]|uniref:Uncharacterized protein n=1 Tax=Occultella aeris TaxID=2761496 RepID=A0A7M4DJF1_9MICO|nr:hypothetical protein [Occultella aeris]VZO37165.1 hypothetical protein HALOF300_02258 [Occultella aeris]